MNAITETKLVPTAFSFRRFPETAENRDKQIPKTPDHELTVDQEKVLDDAGKETGALVFKRATENHDLVVPTLVGLGIAAPAEGDLHGEMQAIVLDSLITDAIAKVGRGLVNDGITPTVDNCNWEVAVKAMHESISAGGAKFGKDLLAEVCELFTKYMVSIGKPLEGIEVSTRMIKARFNAMSVRKFLVALPAIQSNIETWLLDGVDEEGQAALTPVVEYLIERIRVAQLPPEEVDIGSMF